MSTLSPRCIGPQSNDRAVEISPPRRMRVLLRGQSWSYSVVRRMENQHYNNDQWAYDLVANIDHQLPNWTDTSNAPVVDLEEQTPRQSRRRPPTVLKNVSRRGGGFTKDEDAIICSAFLNVSKDVVVGVNQSSGGYYKRMHEFFEAHKPLGSNRSQLAIKGRWGNESGKNEQDRIDEAVKMFEEKEPFSFMHCWRILREEPKWNDRLLELNNTPPIHVAGNGSPMQGNTGNETEAPVRTGGRDKVKKKRSNALFDTSDSSTAVEMLQEMTTSRHARLQKQDAQMAEILSCKDEKIKIQKEMLENQKREIELRQKQHEENLLATQKNQEIRLMESEAQLLNAEAGIMSMDLDKLAPHIHAYYTSMQKRIMERRGFGGSSEN
ncbi:hypothetical protein PVAP13_3NG201556 [Panicum virgatum]|uniref:No apical meristem-associated C-terminal domain-containing protein n=1 Tax=Panicum virgatum TaxID=38727 RepID=A0A8T0UJV2_PANVG|nr:hypothetical protein PVAP13_3NG201556 [Panicum virgatum]